MFRKLTTVLLLLLGTFCSINAQNSCFHRLVMNDTFGDGWDGAEVTVYVNGNANTYTLDGMNDDGSIRVVDINVVEGDSISIEYNAGMGAEIEHSYTFHDSDLQVLFDSGNNPNTGVVSTIFALCPTCPSLPINSLETIDVFAFTADIAWEASSSGGNYVIEYQECGDPTTLMTSMTADTDFTFTGLNENTCYEYDIYLVCTNGDTSIVLNDGFTTIFDVDVGVSGVLRPFKGQKCEFSNFDTLEILIKNYGASPQANIPFNYTINGRGGVMNIPSDGLYTGVIGKDSCHNIAFETPIDISQPGVYELQIWTEYLAANEYALTDVDDGDFSNDTFNYTFVHTYELPFKESFETAGLPDQWTSNISDPIFNTGDHTNMSGVISSYMSGLNSFFTFSTARYGILGADEELIFDYRFITVNSAGNPAAQQLSAGEMLTVEVSDDCGLTWSVLGLINESNHNNTASSNMRTLNYSLAAYAGESVEFRFTVIRNSDEYWADLDDIQIYNCDNGLFDLLDDVEVVDESVTGAGDGAITIINVSGIEPITYDWGGIAGNSNTIENLSAGIYSVTVTDAEGCSQIELIEVRVLVADNELADLESLSLYPNPVKELLQVKANFKKAATVNVSMFNAIGQRVYSNTFDENQELSGQIDVSQLDPGLYIVNLSDGIGQVSKKIIVE